MFRAGPILDPRAAPAFLATAFVVWLLWHCWLGIGECIAELTRKGRK